MLYGYARVSKDTQDLDNERYRLKANGVEAINIYGEVYSTQIDIKLRPQYNKLKERLQNGDILLVTSIDRLARSMRELIDTVNELKKLGVAIKSLRETWLDTSNNSATAQLMFNIFASFAEFERELIRERTRIGLLKAKREGKLKGKPRRYGNEQTQLMWKLLEEGKSKGEVSRMFGMNRAALNRYLTWYPKEGDKNNETIRNKKTA